MPQLNWNEIKRRAIVFASEWAKATRERSEAQTFWNELFADYGIRRAPTPSRSSSNLDFPRSFECHSPLRRSGRQGPSEEPAGRRRAHGRLTTAL